MRCDIDETNLPFTMSIADEMDPENDISKGDLTLSFREYSYGFAGGIWNEASVRVLATTNGPMTEMNGVDYTGTRLKTHFCPSVQEILGDAVWNNSVGFVIGMGEEIMEIGSREKLYLMPLNITKDTITGTIKCNDDSYYIDTCISDMDRAIAWGHYGLSVNQVIYDTKEVQGAVFYGYEGENTIARVYKVNELLSGLDPKYGVEPITLEELFTTPESAYDKSKMISQNGQEQDYIKAIGTEWDTWTQEYIKNNII